MILKQRLISCQHAALGNFGLLKLGFRIVIGFLNDCLLYEDLSPSQQSKTLHTEHVMYETKEVFKMRVKKLLEMVLHQYERRGQDRLYQCPFRLSESVTIQDTYLVMVQYGQSVYRASVKTVQLLIKFIVCIHSWNYTEQYSCTIRVAQYAIQIEDT